MLLVWCLFIHNLDDVMQQWQYDKKIWAFSPKPSFLLNEKVYTKISHSVEYFWLLNAIASTFLSNSKSDEIKYFLCN